MITEAVLAQAAAADSAALAAAAGSAEEALACHRDAVAALAAGWRSETGLAATDLLEKKCAEATDIVAELRRAAAELRLLHDGFADLSGGTAQELRADDVRAAEQPIVATSSRPVGAPAPGQIREDPVPRPDPPAAVPGQAPPPAPWAAQAATGPWTPAAPTGTPEAVPSWQPGGSIPPLPDVGGALVGLIAQIAQTLGSYSDTGGIPPSEHRREEASSPATAAPRPPHRNPPPTTASAGPVSLPDSALPKSAAPHNAVLQPNSPVLSQAPPELPAPELLPAERPPDPGGPPPPPPGSAVEPGPPPPTPAPVDPGPAPAAESETPCEIAADELPKVGDE